MAASDSAIVPALVVAGVAAAGLAQKKNNKVGPPGPQGPPGPGLQTDPTIIGPTSPLLVQEIIVDNPAINANSTAVQLLAGALMAPVPDLAGRRPRFRCTVLETTSPVASAMPIGIYPAGWRTITNQLPQDLVVHWHNGTGVAAVAAAGQVVVRHYFAF